MKHRVVGGAALVLAACMALSPGFGSAQAGPAWGTFHGAATRLGASTVNGPTTNFVANKWTLPKAVNSSPVVDASGTAYVGDDDGNVYALSPATPDLPKWSFHTKAAVLAAPTLSGDGQTLYVPSTDGTVYAIKTSDGSQKWTQELSGTLLASPLLSGDGSTLYVPLPFGSFKALGTADGKIVKSTIINGAIRGSLATNPDGNVVYVATTNNYMYGVSSPTASGGGQLSAFYLDGEALGTPAVDQNGNIYVSTSQGSLDSFTPSNSAPRWIWTAQSRKGSGSTPAIFNGNAYVGSGDQNVYAINISNGQQVWEYRTGGSVGSSPAVAGGNGIVYVGSEDGNVYALNASSGAVVWIASTGAPVSSSPAIGPDGSVWVGSSSGSVYRFRSVDVPAKPSNAPPKATSTPTAVPTASRPTTPSTPGAGNGTLAVTLKAQVKAGAKQVIKVTTRARSVLRFRVNYPNGTHQSARKTASARGLATYTYKQAASKILHNRKYASVIITPPTGGAVTKQYKIMYGRIDASVEPRTQAVGKNVTIWIHYKRNTRVVALMLFPNGHTTTVAGTTRPHGWARIPFHVVQGLKAGRNHKVVVLARVANHPSISTKIAFTIK